MEEYLTAVKDMKEVYFGAQDEYIEKFKKIMFYDDIEYLKTETVCATNVAYYLDKTAILNQSKCKLIKNVRVHDLSNIKKIILRIGGQNIDAVYPEIFNALRKIYGMSNDEIPIYLFKIGIPYLNWHQVDLVFELIDRNKKDKIYVTYDVYNHDKKHYIEVSKGDDKEKVNTYLFPDEKFIYASQIHKEYTEENNKYPFILNHPLYYFILHKDVVNPEFIFDNKFKLKLLKTDEADDYNIYTLTKSLDNMSEYGINFSKIEITKLITNTEKPVDVHCVCGHILRIASGMAGLAFSK
jgi:hypothetical protein